MKLLSICTKISASSIFLLLLCGCMSFEYTGRDFPPLKAGSVPVYFKNEKLIPAGKYTIIGRAVIETGIRTEMEDIQDCLLDEAASRGADAVCLVSVKTVEVGLYADDADYEGPNAPGSNPYNLTPDGAPIQTNLSGQRIEFKEERSSARKVIVKALFLKDSQAVKKLRSAQEKELEKLIDQSGNKGGKVTPAQSK